MNWEIERGAYGSPCKNDRWNPKTENMKRKNDTKTIQCIRYIYNWISDQVLQKRLVMERHLTSKMNV